MDISSYQSAFRAAVQHSWEAAVGRSREGLWRLSKGDSAPPIEHSEEVCAVCLPIGFYFLPIHTTLINTQLEKRKER